MGSPAEPEAELASFNEKVGRTVYLDNLSPRVTRSILTTALGQFGTVKNVQFIQNLTEPGNASCCALVEMWTSAEAKAVVNEITQFPFMVGGAARPVRARPAEVEMFEDRPIKPGRHIQCHWLAKNDPDFGVAKKMKRLVKKHAAEASFLLKIQFEEEQKLAKQQEKVFRTHNKKLEILEGVIADKTVSKLARGYNIRASDD